MRIEKKGYYFSFDEYKEIFCTTNENYFFEERNESTIDGKRKNNIKNYNNKTKGKQIKKINNNIRDYNIIIRNYKIINLFIFTLIVIFCQNNIYNSFYFQYSKITLKIQGIGESNIFGNDIS